MIVAYEQVRPLNKDEQQHWSTMLRAAALRFWLSRLVYRQSLKEAELAPDKDPDVLKCLLLKHRENVSFCQSIVMN
ncbi:MAG: homoserine kinase, partial [Gammaproteobacteria bacterium]|nr:homoserine kinase [Gammaproteobacteria bacterium]